MSKTTDALLQLITRRSKVIRTVRALLGDGTGTIPVSGTDNYVWARPYGRDMPIRTYGPAYKASPNDLPVTLEVSALGARTIYRVLGVDDMLYLGTEVPVGWTSGVGAHAAQHQLSSGGHDAVYIDDRQFLPLLMYATTPASLTVYIAAGSWWGGTALRRWNGGVSDDLTSYVPSAGSAKYLLIYFDDSATLGYLESAEFADVLALIPQPQDVNISLPANSVPLGMILLRGGDTVIPQEQIFAYRNIVGMVTTTSIISDALMLAAQDDKLFSSTGGAWTEIEDADPFMESIEHLVMVTSAIWLAFRLQTAAAAANPIVYRTGDGGITWAKAQAGISFTQGADLWKVTAVWQSPTNASNIAIVIANASNDTNPQVFVTGDGGVAWTEVDNTGLPVTDLAVNEWPVSLAVADSGMATFEACIAMYADDLYYANLPGTTWTQKVTVAENIVAVINDRTGGSKWWAAAQTQLVWTDDDWSTYSGHIFGDDRPSENTATIFQHLTALAHLVVGGFVGTYFTTDAGVGFNQYDAHKIGMIGAVLARCVGDPSKLFVTDSSGALYLSLDAGVSSYQRLALSDVVAVAAITLTSEAPGSTIDISTLEMWLKV